MNMHKLENLAKHPCFASVTEQILRTTKFTCCVFSPGTYVTVGLLK